MNPQPSPSDQEIIDQLAALMGWEKKTSSDSWWCWAKDGHMVARGVQEVGGTDKPWNPLTSWADTMGVVRHVISLGSIVSVDFAKTETWVEVHGMEDGLQSDCAEK